MKDDDFCRKFKKWLKIIELSLSTNSSCGEHCAADWSLLVIVGFLGTDPS